jgi:hypothetical protein
LQRKSGNVRSMHALRACLLARQHHTETLTCTSLAHARTHRFDEQSDTLSNARAALAQAASARDAALADVAKLRPRAEQVRAADNLLSRTHVHEGYCC